LQAFINKGEKPILVTFGSMFHNPEKTRILYETVCEALVKSKSRAILIMPDLPEKTILPENVVLIRQVPYSWLLDHVTIVIHHFGFGTAAEVLKAGLPSIPIPHIFDQKLRASQFFKLGYAHKPLELNRITSDVLSEAILKVKNNEEMKKKCLIARSQISNENGTKKAADLISDYIASLTRHNANNT
jgi:sterol 3beta-glucosyltransferase